MRRIVVGTAGHVDHGKTSLVRALTGVDCDRWQEEKTRGITIDLGFAHLRHEDLQVGFVDVPGHERFLHNALAGLGGIRLMLLVVAADEGVKPQTREHLDICNLLGIPAGLVALTKTDLVSDDLVELAQLEVEELLAETPFAGARVYPVSSETGDGIPELEAALLSLAAEHEVEVDPDRPARLPVDRSFLLKGLGLVVTGTLVSGEIRAGEALELLPPGQPVKVRGVQVHGETRESAEAGERTSLQVAGVDAEQVRRGMQITEAGRFNASNRLCARVRLLADAPLAFEGWTPIRLHLFSHQVVGELRPLGRDSLEAGDEGVVEMRLAAPVVAARGDRFIVTRPSPATTLGGGFVLDPRWRRLRGSLLDDALNGLSGGRRETLRFWVRDAGEGGVGAEELARRLGERPESVAEDLRELTRDGVLLSMPAGRGHEDRWIAPRTFTRIAKRAERVLAAYFEKDRLARGIPKAEAVRRILPGRGAELAGTYLPWLEAQGVIAVRGDTVNQPGRTVELSGEESKLSKAVLDLYRRAGLAPPSPSEASVTLSAKPQILDGVMRVLTDRGDLVRLPGGLIVAGSVLEEVRETLRGEGWERFDVPRFKDAFGISRKWAIPLLEYLDSTGVTKRMGDERMVVR